MTTDFKLYLQSEGYAEHVVEGGLLGLVESWESISKGLSEGNPAFTQYDCFHNDVDCRQILSECMELAEPQELQVFIGRISAADRRFREATIETKPGPCAEEGQEGHVNDQSADWYYFRRPKVDDGSWPD